MLGCVCELLQSGSRKCVTELLVWARLIGITHMAEAGWQQLLWELSCTQEWAASGSEGATGQALRSVPLEGGTSYQQP